MKKLVVVAGSLSLCSCFAGKNIQVSMIGAQLVRIDTVYRYDYSEQLLVWKCSNNMEYVSYAPISDSYKVGTCMTVMVQR